MKPATEKALLFGETRSLAAVVTDPGSSASAGEGVAVVILNAGIVHHVGPNRIHVKLARMLARAGFTAMRFDFSGIGDSQPRLDGKPFAGSALDEVRQALDYLESSRGIRRFLLVGICSGADNALRASVSDPRIIGAALIEAHAVSTPAYLLHLYRGRLFHPSSWLRFLSGRSELWSELFARSPQAKRARAESSKIREQSLVASRSEILAAMEGLGARGVRLLLIYSAGSASHLFYESRLRRRLERLRRNGCVIARTIEGADHVFTHRDTQSELLSAILEWAQES